MTSHTHMTYDVRGFKTSMDDQDMGHWTYAYDALGRLTGQTNANSQSVSLSYDALGRLVQRVEPEGTTTWTYDTAANGIGKLASVTAPGGYSASYTYNTYGQSDQSTVIPGTGAASYVLDRNYDTLGRLATLVYPSFNVAGTAYGLSVGYCYDDTGHLTTVFDRSTGQTCTGGVSQYYWQATAADERDNVTADNLGASPGVLPLAEVRTFDDATGRVTGIGVAGDTTLEDQAYTWDLDGNFTGRTDGLNSASEVVHYDAMNRMKSSTLTVGTVANGQENYAYDSMGNLRQRGSVAQSYVYQEDGTPGVGPHTLQSVSVGGTPVSLTYDNDGNVTVEGTRGLTWASYDKPSFIADSASGISEQFMYGPDRELYQEVASQGGHSITTTHLWGLVDIADDSASGETIRLSITAGSLVIAQQVLAGSAPGTTLYLLHDAMGSVIQQAYVNAGAWVGTNAVAYGPWGDSRDVSTGGANTLAFINLAGMANLGFTGQTNLSLGLVHMGGRVYDPAIGRFLSADPNVQYPLSPQSYNRYVYVNNNPLSYTDPTGYMSLGDIVETIVIIYIAYETGYYADGWAGGGVGGATVGGMAGGATAGYLSTPGTPDDRLKGAGEGGLEGGAFGYIGGSFGVEGSTAGTASYFEKAAVEGLVGGAFSMAGGGRFGDGFLSAAVGSLDEPLLNEIGSADTYHMLEQAIVAAAIGGSLSSLAGGSFADGAVTAAFQNLFNAQEGGKTDSDERDVEFIPSNDPDSLYPYNAYVLDGDGNVVGGPYAASVLPDANYCDSGLACTVHSGTYSYVAELGEHRYALNKKYMMLWVGDAPSADGSRTLSGVWVHKGGYNETTSAGCLTVSPADWSKFISNFSWLTHGQITIRPNE